MNEFEAHESSYDHQHTKRLKEMKQMQRDPNAVSKARKAERKADEKSGLITIKPVKLDSTSGSGGGFKKGGFKNAFGGGGSDETTTKTTEKAGFKRVPGLDVLETAKTSSLPAAESDSDGDFEQYDPRRPTDCFDGCEGRIHVL
ncbi:hypothetical protein MMC25_002455 [Agyrium rufum]|nr:hypothetical protein [Agyrium rufum]